MLKEHHAVLTPLFKKKNTQNSSTFATLRQHFGNFRQLGPLRPTPRRAIHDARAERVLEPTFESRRLLRARDDSRAALATTPARPIAPRRRRASARPSARRRLLAGWGVGEQPYHLGVASSSDDADPTSTVATSRGGEAATATTTVAGPR